MGHYVRDITLLYRTLHLFIILLLYVSFERHGHTYRGFGSIFFDWGMTDCDSLGPLLQPPLVTFGAPLHALIGCLGGRPSTTVRGHLPTARYKNGPDGLLTKGVPGGNVKELLGGLWVVVAELMH
jgi:hypothetical protein